MYEIPVKPATQAHHIIRINQISYVTQKSVLWYQFLWFHYFCTVASLASCNLSFL